MSSDRTENNLTDPNATQGNYRLETLEPRILLSADPMLGELARMAEDAHWIDPAEETAAIIFEVEDAREKDANAGDLDPQEGDGDAVVWPENWTAPAAAEAAGETVDEATSEAVEKAEIATMTLAALSAAMDDTGRVNLGRLIHELLRSDNEGGSETPFPPGRGWTVRISVGLGYEAN